MNKTETEKIRPVWLNILDHSLGQVRIIRMSDEDSKLLQSDIASYNSVLYLLEDKYDFKLSQCSWMFTFGNIPSITFSSKTVNEE